jgi:hypothetical protein
MINKISFVMERAVLAIDAFLGREVLLAWASTLQHQTGVDGGSNFGARPRASKHTAV